MGVALFALGIMGLAFVRGGIEEIVGGTSVAGGKGVRPYVAVVEEGSSTAPAVIPKEEGDHSWGKIKRLLTDPSILALMLWSFFYVSIIP